MFGFTDFYSVTSDLTTILQIHVSEQVFGGLSAYQCASLCTLLQNPILLFRLRVPECDLVHADLHWRLQI